MGQPRPRAGSLTQSAVSRLCRPGARSAAGVGGLPGTFARAGDQLKKRRLLAKRVAARGFSAKFAHTSGAEFALRRWEAMRCDDQSNDTIGLHKTHRAHIEGVLVRWWGTFDNRVEPLHGLSVSTQHIGDSKDYGLHESTLSSDSRRGCLSWPVIASLTVGQACHALGFVLAVQFPFSLLLAGKLAGHLPVQPGLASVRVPHPNQWMMR